jgi:hypothetical protein
VLVASASHYTPLHHILLFLFAGKAEGVLFEDVGDGYEFTRGEYLLTHYVAELHSSVVTVRVSETEGLWKRAKRRLHVQLLLGGGAMVCHIFLRDNVEESKTAYCSKLRYFVLCFQNFHMKSGYL